MKHCATGFKLRNYEGLFSAGVFVSVDQLARRTGLEPRVVAKALGYLRNVGFYYIPPRKEPRITFKMIRVPLDRLVITTASYDNRLAAFKMRIDRCGLSGDKRLPASLYL